MATKSRAALGTTADLKINQARDMAREAIRRIKEGKPATEPPPPKPESVAVVVDNWLRRHVDKNELRTAGELRRVVDRYILPYWADRTFVELRRSDIAALLDVIEDKHGARQADVVLSTLRSVAGWVQSRDDLYTLPFARGMRRVRDAAPCTRQDINRRRDPAGIVFAGEIGQIGPLVKLALLTAQRREKLLTLRWGDIDSNGIWTIQAEEREKGHPGTFQLPRLALGIKFRSSRPSLATRTSLQAGVSSHGSLPAS